MIDSTVFLNKSSIIFKLAAVIVISLLITIIGASYIIWNIHNEYRDFVQIQVLSRLMVKTSNLVHEMQKERGMSSGFLGSKGEKYGSELAEQRKKTDTRKTELDGALAASHTSIVGLFEKAIAEVGRIGQIRSSVDGLQMTGPQAIDYYSGSISLFFDAEKILLSMTSDRDTRWLQNGYIYLQDLKENAGIERATVNNAFSADKFNPGIYERFVILFDRQKQQYAELFKYLNQAQRDFFTATVQGEALDKIDNFRKIAMSKKDGFGVDSKEWFAATTARIDMLKKVEDKIADDLESLAARRQQSVYNKMIIVLCGAVAAALALATFFYMFSRSITTSLRSLLSALQNIADGEGDLTSRLEEKGNDEFTEIAKAFNRFTGNIRKVVGSTFIHSGQITKQSVLLSQVAEKTSRYMRNQNTQTHQAVTAVEQMSSTVKTNAGNANTALLAAKNAETATKDGEAIVSKTREAILQLAHKVTNASQVIGKANAVTGEISEILNVIRDIADQTNLLALNAAIEAASAGEHGRGFAVVAEEVRTLAKRTNVATEEIQKIITQLLDESKKAVTAMEQGTQMTQEVVGHADMAGKSLQTITTEVEKLTQMLNQIAGATEEQSVTAEAIAYNMSIISKSGLMTSDSVDETENICHQLSDLSEEMMNASGNLKTGVPNLTRAKVAHLAWRVKLRKFMYGEASLSLAEAVDHHSCVFGKWYYSEGLKEYSDIREMVDIERPHEQLHSLIREAVQQKNAGRLSEADIEEVHAKVEKISTQIVDLLDTVEKKLLEKSLA